AGGGLVAQLLLRLRDLYSGENEASVYQMMKPGAAIMWSPYLSLDEPGLGVHPVGEKDGRNDNLGHSAASSKPRQAEEDSSYSTVAENSSSATNFSIDAGGLLRRRRPAGKARVFSDEDAHENNGQNEAGKESSEAASATSDIISGKSRLPRSVDSVTTDIITPAAITIIGDLVARTDCQNAAGRERMNDIKESNRQNRQTSTNGCRTSGQTTSTTSGCGGRRGSGKQLSRSVLRDPRLSPMFADFAGVDVPVIIQLATAEVLRDDIIAFAYKLCEDYNRAASSNCSTFSGCSCCTSGSTSCSESLDDPQLVPQEQVGQGSSTDKESSAPVCLEIADGLVHAYQVWYAAAAHPTSRMSWRQAAQFVRKSMRKC
ncbi:unnamed protein product, partial [Amoebophrya sp. A25]